MDIMLLKRTAIQSVAVMLAVITLSFAYRQNNIVTISAYNFNDKEAAEASKVQNSKEKDLSGGKSVDALTVKQNKYNTNDAKPLSDSQGIWGKVDSDIISQMGERYLIIKKPKARALEIELEDLYMTKSLRIHINGSEEAMDSDVIRRIYREYSFIGDPVYDEIETQETDPDGGSVVTSLTQDYGMDFVHGITITNSLTEEGDHLSDLVIQLDNVYAHILLEDETFYYIDLKKPSEVYERILVIDAGHGGKDAGALSSDGNIYEKNINLKILLLLKDLLDKEDIKVYYTRLMDDKVFLRPRVELANAVNCDFFISIHCNANEVKSPSGTEIYYYDKSYQNISNKRLGNILIEEIGAITPLRNRGLTKRQNDDIFILDNANVPAVIVETAYMTNSNDLSYLLKDENQSAIAKGIYNGILRAYNEIEPE